MRLNPEGVKPKPGRTVFSAVALPQAKALELARLVNKANEKLAEGRTPTKLVDRALELAESGETQYYHTAPDNAPAVGEVMPSHKFKRARLQLAERQSPEL